MQEVKRPILRSTEMKVKERPTSFNPASKRLDKKEPLYGILVEEMAQYFNKHTTHYVSLGIIKRNKKLDLLKKCSLPVNGLHCFEKYL